MAVLGVLELLAASPEKVLEMGRNARSRAEQLFTPKTFSAALNDLYSRVLTGAPAVCPSGWRQH
jgi:hypothetical protein